MSSHLLRLQMTQQNRLLQQQRAAMAPSSLASASRSAPLVPLTTIQATVRSPPGSAIDHRYQTHSRQGAGVTPSKLADGADATDAHKDSPPSSYDDDGKSPSMRDQDMQPVMAPPHTPHGGRVGTMASTAPSMGMKTGSRSSLHHYPAPASRSLGASKASLVSRQSYKTIQQEFHHKRGIKRLNRVSFGPARTPCTIATVFFILFILVLVTGLVITCLRHIYQNIFLTLDKGEAIGPILIAGSFIFLGIGIAFLTAAYNIGAKERGKLKYKPVDNTTVTVGTVSARVPDPAERLMSGTTTDNAISRVPIGSNSVATPTNLTMQHQQQQEAQMQYASSQQWE